ncbi:MAG: glycosyltransferase family 39 protein [Acidobacteriota bacterium]|nr:glycosyltransferase family 39 protein [Acidobacteriota bacterium]
MVSSKVLWKLVAGLIGLQLLLTVLVIHRESLTFDEDDHMYAGYMMWHAHDYGLNPEHPPLVKLLAALPVLGRDLWTPPLHNRDFKQEAYLNGRDWLARNDGDRNQMVFQMRLAAGLLAIALSLVVFAMTRELFGDWAALAALTLLALDPNVLAHSALVTTDIGVSLFFLASVWCFYRYVRQPGLPRLVVAGVVAGLLLATKHSGVLLAPMLLLLIGYEVLTAARGTRRATALRLASAFSAIVVVGVLVLWAFYGFRYATRPAGVAMSTTLAEYVAPLGPGTARIINWVGRWHLLPESYLIGLVDVKRMALFYPTFLLGHNYSHGVWWYFPSVLLIKSTLGLLALTAVAGYALARRRLRWSREVVYLVLPGLFYLLVAILSNMNIGARHLLPMYVFLFVLAGGAAATMAQAGRRWMVALLVLMVLHVTSSLAVFPNFMAYANEAWGGPANVHNLLSDANVDWAQQLYQVKAWQDQHPGEACWFAYFATPEILPETYGIHCKHLPTADTSWLGGADNIDPIVEGTVFLSAGDLSGCEWPAASLNPYDAFRSRQPDAMIDYGVMVYRGRFDLHQAAALARAQNAVRADDPATGLALAQEAAALDPASITAQQTLGNLLARAGRTQEARAAWQSALTGARQLDPSAQTIFVPDLEARLKQ